VHAQVITLEGPSEQLDELGRTANEHVLPTLTQVDGFRGMVALADRKSGKVLLVTLWESEEAWRQGEQAVWQLSREAEQLRRDTAGVVFRPGPRVESYEVLLSYTL
jgi:heme-degrading monooxygenase HmoA